MFSVQCAYRKCFCGEFFFIQLIDITLCMASIALIFICLLIGFLFKKFKLVGPNSFKALNTLVVYVALPALTLQYIPNIEIKADLIFPILMPWINIILAWLLFGYLGNRLGGENL